MSEKRYAEVADIIGDTGPPVIDGAAPEFAAVPAGRIRFWLRVAQKFVGLEEWGEEALCGHQMATAHCLARHVNPDDGASSADNSAGPITQEKDGPASVSYGGPTFGEDDAFWTTTSYGQAFLAMRQRVMGRALAQSTLTRLRGGRLRRGRRRYF